jgi:5'-3' exonuclease
VAAEDARVERVFICTPDKDLGQCVRDPLVVQVDRRRDGKVYDEAGVRERFGVDPASIPDYLALVGDSADGFPGLPGWGAKSAATVLARWGHVADIPPDAADWEVSVRGAPKLAATLAEGREAAQLFLTLARLRDDADVGTVDDWEWRGPQPELAELATRLGSAALVPRAERLAAKRFG